MRISTAYQFDTYSQNITDVHNRLIDAQNQVQSGKKLNKPSDDPYGTTLSLTMTSLQSGLTQYASNLNFAKGYLGFTEQSLSDMNNIAQSAYSISVSGSTATMDQAGRTGLAQQVASLQQRLISVANTRGPSNAYIFAGQNNTTQPYVLSGSTLTYTGDTNNVLVETGPGSTMAANTQGSPMIETLYQRLETLRQDLTNGSVSNIGDTDLPNLQSSISAISLARGDVGTRLNTVADLTDQHKRRSDELTSDNSDITEIDYAEAITKYSAANAAYQAALSVASQGFKTSLMDYIR